MNYDMSHFSKSYKDMDPAKIEEFVSIIKL